MYHTTSTVRAGSFNKKPSIPGHVLNPWEFLRQKNLVAKLYPVWWLSHPFGKTIFGEIGGFGEAWDMRLSGYVGVPLDICVLKINEIFGSIGLVLLMAEILHHLGCIKPYK